MGKQKRYQDNNKAKQLELKTSFDVPIVYICAMCQKEMNEPIKAYVKGPITFFLCSDICYRGYREHS